jgi:hypothetical protein
VNRVPLTGDSTLGNIHPDYQTGRYGNAAYPDSQGTSHDLSGHEFGLILPHPPAGAPRYTPKLALLHPVHHPAQTVILAIYIRYYSKRGILIGNLNGRNSVSQ